MRKMAKIAGRGLADTVATLAARDAQIASDVDAMWFVSERRSKLLYSLFPPHPKCAGPRRHLFSFLASCFSRLMVGALFVFFIQVGFALKEAGSVATKNTRLILLKVKPLN